MARITVEDCLDNVDNRFELVMLAAKRARQLSTTAVDPTVPWDGDKVTVVALREIAEGNIGKKQQAQEAKDKLEAENIFTPEATLAFEQADQLQQVQETQAAPEAQVTLETEETPEAQVTSEGLVAPEAEKTPAAHEFQGFLKKPPKDSEENEE